MKKIYLSLVLSTLVMQAEDAFSFGQQNFTFNISQDNDYTVVGGSLNYFMIDGLSVGLSFSTWLGDEPSINQITVPLTYYVSLEPQFRQFYVPLRALFRPYIGAFFSRTFMEDIKYKDYNSYGGRIGVAMQLSENSYMSFGWVQEKFNDGREEDSRGYPEFGGGISF